MSDQELSVLARKISANGAKAEAFPDLGPFAAAVGNAAAESAGELLGGDFEAATTERLQLLAEHMTGKPDPGFYYWLLDDDDAPSALIAIAPSFASAVSARLLGGDLVIGADDVKPSGLDFGMAASLVDIARPALAGVFEKLAPRAPSDLFAAKRGGRTVKEILKDRETLSVFAVSIDLALGEAKAPAALSVAFPAPVLDKAGLMRRARTTAPDPGKTRSWADQMRRNVLATEIPLSVVLDRFVTNVGELSRLDVGKVIDVRANALQHLELAATTTGGAETVAKARLGAYHGHKAVKLTSPIDPDFIRGLAND